MGTTYADAKGKMIVADDAMKRQLAPSAAIVSLCKRAPLAHYGRHLKGGAHTYAAYNGGWQIPLALNAWSGNSEGDSKLLEQIDQVLEGGHTLSATGGYSAQHERHVTAMFAILKQSPRFWEGVLDAGCRAKIDLLMKATLVASAYTTSDVIYAEGMKHTSMDGDPNLHRGWNPNFREGMFGAILVSMVYFGGVDATTEILNNYDHATFVAELRKAGLSNTHGTFTWAEKHPESGAPSAEQIEKAVHKYRFEGKPLMEPFELYRWLTLNTYNRKIAAGLNNGKGIVDKGVAAGCIVAGADKLPNLGKLGMLTEFDSVDASGRRSSMTYSYDGFRPNLAHHAVVLVGGYWPADGSDAEVLERLKIGITDIAYKLKHGYRNYAHATGSTDVFTLDKDGWNWSTRTTLPLWTELLLPSFALQRHDHMSHRNVKRFA